jgi:hypothetical protein
VPSSAFNQKAILGRPVTELKTRIHSLICRRL